MYEQIDTSFKKDRQHLGVSKGGLVGWRQKRG